MWHLVKLPPSQSMWWVWNQCHSCRNPRDVLRIGIERQWMQLSSPLSLWQSNLWLIRKSSSMQHLSQCMTIDTRRLWQLRIGVGSKWAWFLSSWLVSSCWCLLFVFWLSDRRMSNVTVLNERKSITKLESLVLVSSKLPTTNRKLLFRHLWTS